MIKTEKICKNNHKFYKSSDCPVCPICEKEKSQDYFIDVAAPARRALQSANIYKIEDFTKFSEKEIKELHGIGKNALNKICNILNINNIYFKN